MDWIKQNKSLAGFLGITVVAAGGLGFLAFSASGKYSEATDAYTQKAQELKTLQTQQPFPDDANLKKMQGLVKVHQAAIDSLHKELAAAEIPLKPLTPEKFQDNLRESVRRMVAKAGEQSVALPKENFYMGYDKYQATPPKPEAAPYLGQMLEAMELAMTTLIEAGISSVEDLKPELLPVEGGADKSSDSKPQEKSKSNDKDKDKGKGKQLVERSSFEVEFTSREQQVRKFINSIISSKQQFFVPKSIAIANESDKGPVKGAAALPPTPNDPGATPPAVATKQYVVGDEKVKVVARFEVVHFAKPSEPSAK